MSLSCSIVIRALHQRMLSGLNLFSCVCLARPFFCSSLVLSQVPASHQGLEGEVRVSTLLAFNSLLTCSLKVKLLKRENSIMSCFSLVSLSKNAGGVMATVKCKRCTKLGLKTDFAQCSRVPSFQPLQRRGVCLCYMVCVDIRCVCMHAGMDGTAPLVLI